MIGSDEGGQEITLTPRNYENAHLNMEKVLQIPYSGKRLHPTVCMDINISEHRWCVNIKGWQSLVIVKERIDTAIRGKLNCMILVFFLGRKKNCLQILMDEAGVRDSTHTFKSSKWSQSK